LREDFLAISKVELEANDFALLETVRLLQSDESVTCGVLTKWYAWEHALRNELVKRRAPKLGLNAEDYLRGNEHNRACALVADEVFQIESPFTAEEALDRARWRFLEELEIGHYFDMEKLVVYALKLQILTRRSFFDSEEGREKLNAALRQAEEIWDQGIKGVSGYEK
jgi:hypothetical protein